MFGLLLTPNALALSARTISTEQAQGNTGSIITLEVAPGYGLNINLIPTGEVVKKAWIDDPSQIVLSFDGNLCQSSGDSECSNEGATVIHLRQIKPINFPDLPRSPGGGTLLTLITEGGSEGRKIYQFKVVPTSGQPKYTVLSINPDIEQISPAIPPAPVRQVLPMVQSPNQPTSAANAPQWQAQPPAVANQANSAPSDVSLPPVATGANPAVDSQQVTPTLNQNTVAPTPVVTAAPEASPVPKVSPSTIAKLPSQNAPSRQPTPNAPALTSAQPERKLANPNPTPTKTPNNSLTQSETNPNRVEMPTPAPPSPNLTNNEIASSSSNSMEQANTIVRGLQQARQKGQINFETTTWKKVQSVVRLLRRGEALQEAATEVGVSLQLIDQLLVWGSSSAFTTSSN